MKMMIRFTIPPRLSLNQIDIFHNLLMGRRMVAPDDNM